MKIRTFSSLLVTTVPAALLVTLSACGMKPLNAEQEATLVEFAQEITSYSRAFNEGLASASNSAASPATALNISESASTAASTEESAAEKLGRLTRSSCKMNTLADSETGQDLRINSPNCPHEFSMQVTKSEQGGSARVKASMQHALQTEYHTLYGVHGMNVNLEAERRPAQGGYWSKGSGSFQTSKYGKVDVTFEGEVNKEDTGYARQLLTFKDFVAEIRVELKNKKFSRATLNGKEISAERLRQILPQIPGGASIF